MSESEIYFKRLFHKLKFEEKLPQGYKGTAYGWFHYGVEYKNKEILHLNQVIKDLSEGLDKTNGFIIDFHEYKIRECICDTGNTCYSCFLWDRMDETSPVILSNHQETIKKARGE